MSWITVIWSMSTGACLVLALMHAFVWMNDRKGRTANLAFAVMAVAVAVFAAFELALMRAETPEQFGIVVRWIHVPGWVITASLVIFVRLYLRAGRPWLAWAVVGVRTLSLILNFIFSPNINYRQITTLRHISFLGESVSVATGVPNPWMLVAQLSLLLLVIFVTDAAIAVWRRGDRRQALMVGGSILLFTIMATAEGATIAWGIISMPVTTSLFFQGLVAAIACELSYDVLRAEALAQRLHTSEAALQESEKRFRIAADAAPVMLWMSGVDKLCVFFNKAWLEFTGRPTQEQLGDGWSDGVHPDDLAQCLATYSNSFDVREPFTMQYRLRRHDGEYRWITDQGVPRYDTRGQFAGYVGACVDITESLEKEEALREFEERVTLAAEAAHLGVWEFNTATNKLWVSDKVRKLFQFAPGGEIAFADFRSRLHPDDRARRDAAINDAIATHGGYDIEYRIVLSDGSQRWMLSRAQCVRDGRGQFTRLIGVSADVTERKQAQDLFRLATEASPSGILLVNSWGKIILVNAQMEELFGYQRDELIGKRVEMLVPERFLAEHQGLRTAYLTRPERRRMGSGRELFARRKDGGEFPVEIGLNPIQTPEGTLVLASVVDISARKRAEEEAQLRRGEINRLTRVGLLGEMAGSIAHEVNQPLGAMMANASAMIHFIDRGHVDPERLREILSSVVRDGRRARDVIDNIRDTIKKGTAARKNVALNDVVRNVMHMVQPDAAALSCELRASLAEHLPTIDADPVQIQQVLINLLGNAFDAMRDISPSKRKVEIATELDAGSVRVSVRDHGIGIAKTSGERLFEQFYTTKEDGLGMGLAIVRSIIQAHSGTISAENAEGGGARFVFALPASDGSLE